MTRFVNGLKGRIRTSEGRKHRDFVQCMEELSDTVMK